MIKTISDIWLAYCGQIQQLQEPLSMKKAQSFKIPKNFSVFQLQYYKCLALAGGIIISSS